MPNKEEDPTDKLIRRPRSGSQRKKQGEAKASPPKPKAPPKAALAKEKEGPDVEEKEIPTASSDGEENSPAIEGGDVSPKVMLGLPWLKAVHPAVSFFVTALAKLRRDHLTIIPKFGDSMVYHARNKIAKRFLESDCEYLMMIDDDTIVPVGMSALHRGLIGVPASYPDSAINKNVIDRLISQKRDVVGCVYWQRKDEGAPMFAEGLTNPQARGYAKEAVNNLYKTNWVGTGAIMIHRSVFTRIRDHFGDSLIQPEECGSYGYFYPDMFGGEDTAFCRRAREAGCEIYVDLGCHALHLGFKVFGAHTAMDG